MSSQVSQSIFGRPSGAPEASAVEAQVIVRAKTMELMGVSLRHDGFVGCTDPLSAASPAGYRDGCARATPSWRLAILSLPCGCDVSDVSIVNAVWLFQSMFLAEKSDLDDIATAIARIQKQAPALAAS
jgi:hypothetical protein